jgi:hypothetical protein
MPAVHWQLTLQLSVREPLQLPQAMLRVAPGVQTPWLLHTPTAHWQFIPQVSVCMPQFPHGSDRRSPGTQGPSF